MLWKYDYEVMKIMIIKRIWDSTW